VINVQDSLETEARLKKLGKNVTLVTVNSGGHYDAMIDDGIPSGIKWLKQLKSEK
jgi:hypothetical protein